MPAILPFELLYIIFLQVAESSTSSCRTLCAVSSWVRHLALPFLYRTVSIACPSSLTFCPADALRHLWVPFVSKTLAPIVRYCDNVSHLAVHPRDLVRLSNVTAPSPEHQNKARVHAGKCDLHVVLLQNYAYRGWPISRSSYYVNGTHSLFHRITHLRLEDPIKPAFASRLPISDMPRLTHLAAPGGNAERNLYQVFEDLDWVLGRLSGTSVKVFVVVLMQEFLGENGWRAVEDRVCELHEENGGIYAVGQDRLYQEWNTEVRGGTTIWERAVEHTQRLVSRV
ncbi:hypothetical protein BD779DRAFT_1561229 [Infundibulicybe gibba]|nr:hypothetical protein BD779DRAFT_1561229 [Infundibulicybe gibba]